MLVFGKSEVSKVSGGLAVGVLAYAGDDDVSPAGGCNRLVDAVDYLVLIISLFVVAHALLEGDVGCSELIAEGLVNGVVLLGKVLGTALPCIAPASVEAAHLVGIWAGKEDAYTLAERKHTFVLEKNLGLLRGGQGLGSELCTAIKRIVCRIHVRIGPA